MKEIKAIVRVDRVQPVIAALRSAGVPRLVCRAEDVPRFVDLIRTTACTGRRGDGVILVSDVERTVKIRTGDENALALL